MLDDLYEEMASLDGTWRREEWGPGDAWRARASAHQYRMLFDLLGTHVPSGSRVLDWGSGAGRFSFALLRLGYDVDGFDFVEPPMRPTLAEIGGDRYRFQLAADPATLPYDADTFDAVTSVGVLEHVRDTGGDELESLAEIKRVLRPGGAFVCVHFPNRWSWIDFAARRVPGAHHHEFRYRPSDIRELMARTGFELVSPIRSYGLLPRNRLVALPDAVSETRAGVRAIDLADRLASAALSPLCQNFAFVARRPGPT